MARPTLPTAGQTPWDATLNAAINDVSDRADAASKIRADDPNLNYRVVACALQNTGSPNWWQPIDNSAHHPIGVASVTSSGSNITLTYSFAATRVGGLIVAPDETLGVQGYTPGASVGLTSSIITLPKPTQAIASKIYWTGTAWSYFGSTVSGITYSAGKLHFSHASVSDLGATVVLQSNGSPAALPYYVVFGTLAATYSEIWFVDRATGSAYTGPIDAGMSIVVTRSSTPGYYGDVTTITDPGANLWVYGVFEV